MQGVDQPTHTMLQLSYAFVCQPYYSHTMDAILGYRPPTTFAIEQMDRAVLESAKTSIVRSYREFGMLETILDPAALAGIRALAEPFNLRHITRVLVQSLNAEGFHSYWDRSGIHGPFAVKVSWRVALKNASRAQRQAKKLRSKDLCSRLTLMNESQFLPPVAQVSKPGLHRVPDMLRV